ncbi:unnamed protein product [Lactuca virosa]|uniref:Uncharacterized protein n=1 Tax=Lactuca virosa TaxID=75947 RepID=A0AAU9LYL1_9ASTR|nr:unnamed protein product [Lactuca virosa]CAH1439152.1 unnamed protein product [Lactuca virosa]
MIDREIMMKANNPTTNTVCGHCGFLDRKILHHVRRGGNFRRLCTTCVLRLHSQYFCPTCFIVYDRSPPEHAVVCNKCYSSAHPTCVSPPISAPTPSSRAPSPSPSPCATCLNPSRLVFDPKRTDGNGGMDNDAARLLVTAAEISSLSMSKAEVVAVAEAERRAKEASYTRKRAREALDHVVYLMENEKKKNINGNKVVAMPMMDVRINNNNNKVVAANQVSEAFKSVVLKENADGIALSEVQNKMRAVRILVCNLSIGFWWFLYLVQGEIFFMVQ